MYLISIVLYVVLLATVFVAAYLRHRDLFHPAIFLVPLFLFIYAIMPLYLFYLDPNTFAYYLPLEDAAYYQGLVIGLSAALFMGVSVGARKLPARASKERDAGRFDGSFAYVVGVILGFLGLAAWIYGVANQGGFYGAYGRSYGGGWAASGYLREAVFLGLVAVPLIYLGRSKSGMRKIDWFLVTLLIAPVLFHGLFGARRGPTFMALVVVGGGWIYFFRKRIPLLFGVGGGVAVGLLVLLLVVNRSAIYLGSEETLTASFGQFFERWHSNEYLYGSAVVRYADGPGGYFYGARILAHTIAHIIPRQIWPTQYDDITAFFNLNINLQVNSGIDNLGIYRAIGWKPPVGAAPGLIGDIWLEFGYLSPLAMFLIGSLYGRIWRLARGFDQYKLLHILMVALSIYLVTQSLEAWTFRVIMFGAPLLIIGWIAGKRRRGGSSYLPARAQSYGPAWPNRRPTVR